MRLDPDLRARVVAYATETGQTLTSALVDLVRRALDARLARQAGARARIARQTPERRQEVARLAVAARRDRQDR